MSIFSEANKDAMSVAPEQAARSPTVGFFKGFELAYEAQTRTAASYGIQSAMWDEEDRQVQAMRKAGVEDVPVLTPGQSDFWQWIINPGNEYVDAARFYEDGGDPAVADQLGTFDKRIEDLRAKYPQLELKTSRELWDTVRNRAQEAEKGAYGARNDFGGAIGGFIGGTIGALNPNTDPWNFATLPLGGGGKTVLGRIAGQGAAQGAIEMLNQFTGVQEQRRLLGLDSGFGDAAMRVGGAIVGGAAVQSVGEIFGAGVRRMFGRTPGDLAPEIAPTPRRALPAAETVPQGVVPARPDLQASVLTQRPQALIDFLHEVSPFGTSRQAKARTVLDLDYVASRLNDWSEPVRPWEIPPKTDTLPIAARGDMVALPLLEGVVARSNIDAIARRVDPDTFRQFDALTSEKQAYLIWLRQEAANRPRLVENNRALLDVGDEITRIDDQIARVGAMKAKKLRAKKAELVAQRDSLLDELNKGDTSNMSAMRQAMMSVDERMRDLAPQVSRAYARAQNKWDVNKADHEAIVAMMRDGRTDFQSAGDFVDRAEVVGRSLVDEVPMLARATPEEAAIAGDAADTMAAVMKRDAVVMDEATERMRASLNTLLDPERKVLNAEDGRPLDEITIEGYDTPLHLDRDTIDVPVEDGEGTRKLTVRQFLTEQLEREEDLAAITSCSIPKIL
jgi:hypothetical protein